MLRLWLRENIKLILNVNPTLLNKGLLAMLESLTSVICDDIFRPRVQLCKSSAWESLVEKDQGHFHEHNWQKRMWGTRRKLHQTFTQHKDDIRRTPQLSQAPLLTYTRCLALLRLPLVLFLTQGCPELVFTKPKPICYCFNITRSCHLSLLGGQGPAHEDVMMMLNSRSPHL